MPKIVWDQGTAYDFFISLFVLHHPDRFGLRGQWAAGVRSRLPHGQREFLEEAAEFLPVPLPWVFSLPAENKDAAEMLNALEAIPAEARLMTLLRHHTVTREIEDVIHNIQSKRAYTADELEVLKDIYQRRLIPVKQKSVQKLAETFIAPERFGEDYLKALKVYLQVFFAEDETRIRSALQSGLSYAQDLAAELPLQRLLEELSHGISYEPAEEFKEIYLAPSFWTTPLVFFNKLTPDSFLMVFGARPESQNLVPGEYVPEVLLSSLKALSDGTRLRILRYLNEKPDTPSGLARKLRLRAPTVVHHLSVLRLAGLVYLIISQEGERRYALRKEAMQAAMAHLTTFLETSESE